MSYYFTILGPTDTPLYELDIGSHKNPSAEAVPSFPQEIDQLKQFIVNASLDILQDLQMRTPQIFYPRLDSFYGYNVLAYLLHTNVKLVILTNTKANDEAIRQFFSDVSDLVTKKMITPFYKTGDVIVDSSFDSRVKVIAKKYL